MSEEWSGGKSGPPGQDHHSHQSGLDPMQHQHRGGGDHSTNGPPEGMAGAAHHHGVHPGRYGGMPPGVAGYPPPDAYNPPSGPGSMIPPPPVLPEAAAAAAAAAGYPPLPPHYQQPWHPYGPPPPYHGYPPHYPSPYGPPPPYPQHMNPYGYDPAMAAAQQAYGDPNAGGYPNDHGGHDEDDDDDDDGDPETEIGSYGAAARMKMYVKSKVPTRQEILDRRARKNAQSRARASKLRDRIMDIKDRPRDELNEEELGLLEQYENRRGRKNDRSRERAIEKKSEIDRILNKPERKRSKIERQFLETALTAKQRKNEGDRLRRQRIKVMGKKGTKSVGGGHARSPYGDPSLPMSPLPGHQYPGSSAPPYGYSSPRRGAPPGVMEAPAGGGGVPLPFVPPPQQGQYGADARSQLHLPQSSSQVEQRRNPDGSLSISIGGARGGEEIGDMGMLLYGEGAGGEGAAGGEDDEV